MLSSVIKRTCLAVFLCHKDPVVFLIHMHPSLPNIQTPLTSPKSHQQDLSLPCFSLSSRLLVTCAFERTRQLVDEILPAIIDSESVSFQVIHSCL